MKDNLFTKKMLQPPFFFNMCPQVDSTIDKIQVCLMTIHSMSDIYVVGGPQAWAL